MEKQISFYLGQTSFLCSVYCTQVLFSSKNTMQHKPIRCSVQMKVISKFSLF